MALMALMMSHRDASLEELEQASIPAALLPSALPCLLRAPDVKEAIVLSTCNRTEIYTWTTDPASAASQIRLFLDDLKGMPPGWAESSFRLLEGEEVIRHLFRVAAGLDSMVIGEAEIQGQVRQAYRAAEALGAVGPHLHGLFRWALETGKRVRSSTGLARATDSLPKASIRAIDAVLGGIAGKKVLVVGGGKMAEASIRAALKEGAVVTVMARRQEVLDAIRAAHPVNTLGMQALLGELSVTDAAVFATSAAEPLIGPDGIRKVLASRGGKRLVTIDLGLPRNVDPAVAPMDDGKDGFYLFDLDGLDRAGYTTPGGREAQIATAAAMIQADSERCVAWFRARPADAVVAAIQERAKLVAAQEALAASRKIAGLDEDQRLAVQHAIQRAVKKVIHTPTVRTKEACARGDGSLLEAARWLFGIEDTPEPVGSHEIGEVR